MRKGIALFLCVVILLGIGIVPISAANDKITVLLNGSPMVFDVDPVLMNDRTLVPMRAIFEALGCDVSWVDDTQTAIGVRNGITISITVGETTAFVRGEGVTLDQPAVLLNDRTLVPLRFVSESLGAQVDWDEPTQTVTITAEKVPQIEYVMPTGFADLGTWKMVNNYIQGLATGSTAADASGAESKPATAKVTIKEDGEYRFWVNARDYATNQPGTRTFHAAIDGKQADVLLGAHGEEGFRWTDCGVYTLTKGDHEVEILDTSGFYARCGGFIISQDLDFVPTDDPKDMQDKVMAYDPLSRLPVPVFPTWAKQEMTAVEKTDAIENDTTRIVFYKGQGSNGDLVQNEIYIKVDGNWVLVKEKTEELGYLMMNAEDSTYAGLAGEMNTSSQTVTLDGKTYSMATENFFKSGFGTWFVPSDYEKTADNKIVLTFPAAEKASLTVTFEFDDVSSDPKVTLNPTFNANGAYSFLMFSGDGVQYEDFERVTAPFLYVKKELPEQIGGVLSECFLFTPMSTFSYAADKVIAGKEFTSGLVMDPSYITTEDNYSYPDTSKFGVTFKTITGEYRNQIVAPLFGTEHCKFNAGDTTSISYRIINNAEGWYDTFKEITTGMYNLGDYRTNYFHSLNEAIYNTTDLMMDDDYGGWDDNAMSFYNMEQRELTTTANALAIIQRYMLTEDEEYLEERAIPTLAYVLGRKSYHFKPVDAPGGSTGYISTVPAPIGSPVSQFGTSVYGGLYEMTQGRVPALLDYGVSHVSTDVGLKGINSMAAMYKYTGDELYLNKLKEIADEYLENHPGKVMDKRFIGNFIYGDYINMVTALTNAYEVTKDQKYLDEAKASAELLMTGIWTTGYQNDNLTTTYTVDPDSTMERLLNCEQFNFWWHGDKVWRLGNVDGEAKKPQDLDLKIPEETVPTWLIAKAGLGTEHTRTPGHGNIITMNNWAGTIERLAEYTGEDYFSMQARNAMLGRFGNYAGYYQDRNIVHQMHENYPYTGPDYTSIYWHHIPVFLSMLEDYLINSVWAKSNGNIEFPGIYQNGYAYFASTQYGQAPGKFYDQDDMWLWLDRGIIEPDSVNIDYITARKDGVLGLALINEDNKELTTTVTLGEKVPGGSTFSGTATVYDADGNTSSVEVTNGVFTITIPSKDIRSLVLNIPGVETPGFAKTFTYSNALGETVSNHTNGKGYVLQLTDDNYFAYVYVTDMAKDTSNVKITYTIDGKTYTQEKANYPFEFLIKVDDPTQAFTYSLEATSATNGKITSLGGGTLKPLSMTNTQPKLTIPQETIDEALPLGESKLGTVDAFAPETKMTGHAGGEIRIVTYADSYPFEVGENDLRGLRVYGAFKHNANGEVKILDSIVTGNEIRDNGEIVVLCKPTKDVPLEVFDPYIVTIALASNDSTSDIKALIDTSPYVAPPEPEKPVFEPFKLTMTGQGTGSGAFRFVVSTANFPFEVTENGLKGLLLHVKLTSKSDGSVLEFEDPIISNEMRSGATVIVVKPSNGVKVTNYDNDKAKTHTIELELKPVE